MCVFVSICCHLFVATSVDSGTHPLSHIHGEYRNVHVRSETQEWHVKSLEVGVQRDIRHYDPLLVAS
jgi:hypothetical protein